MPLTKLRCFLDAHNIKYLVITHSLAYTAQGIASHAHLSGYKLAKTVIVKLDGKLAMAVLPAPYLVDLDLLRTVVDGQKVELASEREFRNAFPDCETGAMPPFGNLYNMPVFADVALGQNDETTFNAGTHYELIRMDWDEVVRLVKPKIVHLIRREAERSAA